MEQAEQEHMEELNLEAFLQDVADVRRRLEKINKTYERLGDKERIKHIVDELSMLLEKEGVR